MNALYGLLSLIFFASSAIAQENPLSTNNQRTYGYVKMILLRSAEKTPEEHYAFKPTAEVRSFGQIVSHVADSQYTFCSIVLGEKNPAPGVEKSKTSKAEIITALKESFAYCDRAYNAMTDTTATDMVKFNGSTPKLGVLEVNNIHSIEHYGNLITYMRMKGIVPPTSEPEFLKPAQKK